MKKKKMLSQLEEAHRLCETCGLVSGHINGHVCFERAILDSQTRLSDDKLKKEDKSADSLRQEPRNDALVS